MERIEKEYRDIKGHKVIIEASPHGYHILYNYKVISEAIEDTAENNLEAALKTAKEKVVELISKEDNLLIEE